VAEKYVAYYRVSRRKQERSGLGLEAQREKISRFIADGDRALIAEYQDVQSGCKNDRVQLWQAIATAKKNGARLVIAKLDRFSRRVSFIASLMEESIGLTVANMPNATDFQLHIFAALAQEERRMIAERTKEALAAAKRRNVKLGANGKALAIANRQRAEEFAASIMPIIAAIGFGNSYSAIAVALNRMGLRTLKGKSFAAQTVKNIFARYNDL
jgi:DNA invertase Pin-like site-specific DNA recombinase